MVTGLPCSLSHRDTSPASAHEPVAEFVMLVTASEFRSALIHLSVSELLWLVALSRCARTLHHEYFQVRRCAPPLRTVRASGRAPTRRLSTDLRGHINQQFSVAHEEHVRARVRLMRKLRSRSSSHRLVVSAVPTSSAARRASVNLREVERRHGRHRRAARFRHVKQEPAGRAASCSIEAALFTRDGNVCDGRDGAENPETH